MLQLIASIVPILPASLLWEIGAADWDAWGNSVAASGAQSGMGWAGELRDPATGLTYLRARDYSPGTGRFTSRDSLSPNGSGTLAYEPYGYANLNPTTMVDPTGHQAMAGTLSGGSALARCFQCTPVIMAVIQRFAAAAAVLAAQARAALRNYGTALLWAGAVFALVAGIFACLGSAACHEALPRVQPDDDVIRRPREPEPISKNPKWKWHPDPEPKPTPDPKLGPDPVPVRDPTPDPERKDRNCKPRPFIRDYFRENLACHTGENPPKGPLGDDAHHIFPWQFQVEFAEIFKNPFEIHDPANGAWWELRDHRYVRRAPYNNRWRGFLFAFPGRLPPEMDTRAFGVQIMQEFSPIPRAAGVH